MKQILRRLLKSTISGTTETKVFERIEMKVLTEEELTELLDVFGDDPEEAFMVYGLAIDLRDELSFINLDSLSGALEDYLKDEDNDLKNTILDRIQKKIAPLHQYNLDFES